MPRIAFNDLPYNRQVLLVIREAVIRGADPQQVLPGARWLIVWGYLSEAELLAIPPDERARGSSQAENQHFFTRDNELMRFGGRTYALTIAIGNQAGSLELSSV